MAMVYIARELDELIFWNSKVGIRLGHDGSVIFVTGPSDSGLDDHFRM